MNRVALFLQEPGRDDTTAPPIKEQERFLRERAVKLGLFIPDSAITETVPQWLPGRRGFHDLVARIESEHADAILVWSLHQLSTNATDSSWLAWALRQRMVKTIYTADEIMRNTGRNRRELISRLIAAGSLNRETFEKLRREFAHDVAPL